ncbi:MAG: glutathione S-transferase family protein [Halioglobus sp.]
MLALYHNAVSTCSQKVRLVLAHKGLDFTSHEIDLVGGGQHDPDYVRLNPNHVVPTLVHDGAVLIESTLINEYLEEAFPDNAMMPAEPAGRHAARLWTKLLDEKVHPATPIVTFAIGPRTLLLQQPAEVLEAQINAMPNPAARATRRSVLELGVKAPEFAAALKEMLNLLIRMEETLAARQWLASDNFSLADAAALPYVLRLDALAMTPVISSRPHVADWYHRVRSLPGYDTAVTQWMPAFIAELFRTNGEAVWADVEPLTHG